MNGIITKHLAVTGIIVVLTGCASYQPSTKCVIAGAAAGTVATSGEDRENIIKGALGGAVLGTLLCMAMDSSNADDDQDGIANQFDQCPATPLNTIVGETGCSTDIDQDGVVNTLDQCANTPAGIRVNDTGCPIQRSQASITPKTDTASTKIPEPEPAIQETSIVIDNLYFGIDSAKLTAANIKKLILQTQPLEDSQQLSIQVIGHTDDTGSEQYNRQLSLERAKSVVDALRAHGFAKSTLQAQGMGESQPVIANDSEFTRSKNRRVELKISHKQPLLLEQ